MKEFCSHEFCSCHKKQQENNTVKPTVLRTVQKYLDTFTNGLRAVWTVSSSVKLDVQCFWLYCIHIHAVSCDLLICIFSMQAHSCIQWYSNLCTCTCNYRYLIHCPQGLRGKVLLVLRKALCSVAHSPTLLQGVHSYWNLVEMSLAVGAPRKLLMGKW